mgnify:CR=1 FL=1
MAPLRDLIDFYCDRDGNARTPGEQRLDPSKIAPRFGFFLSGGYDWTRRYGHAENFDKGLFGEAGIILSAK